MNSSGIDREFDHFYDDDDKIRKIKFSPPAYLQRYNAVLEILRSPRYRGKLHKVVDFGCSQLGFFKHLKNISGIYEILCVDIDARTLEMNVGKIQPLSADYLHMKDHALNVYVYEGSIIHRDRKLENSDAIICIELIEHLYPETLMNVPENIFGFIKPQLAIFTTPNADFNILFSNLNGFRHDDHKFEWTRRQFEDWANDIINRYPDYEVTFEGICPGPAGTEKFGCCSQMAVFNRRENIHIETTSGVNGLFKLIANIEYPFRIDVRTNVEKILDEATYYIRKYQSNCNYEDEMMPMNLLIQLMDNVDITIESLRDILSHNGYGIVDDEFLEPKIILPQSSICSGVTSDSNVKFDDWSGTFHSVKHGNDTN